MKKIELRKFKLQFPMSVLLLVYTFFCVSLYDPVVAVDDTPRKPIFKKVLSPSGAMTCIKTRAKASPDKLDNSYSLDFMDAALAHKPSLASSLSLTIFSFLEQFHVHNHTKYSITIRAPSVS